MKHEEPTVRVGIMTAKQIQATHHGGFEPCFELADVVIGKEFHWERKENQKFSGELEIMCNPDGTLTAVNVVPVEEYLKSVISSEMNARAHIELLKAHAVISRSWLLAQIDRGNRYEGARVESEEETSTPEAIVKWYDHADHEGFDVCADDHCQRYQGITRRTTPQAMEAVESTRGLTLTFDGKICDARFSKCCGGATEEFHSCWEPVNHPYLSAIRDDASGSPVPRLTQEDEARRWIETSPDAFCNTSDTRLLEQVLNNYDREDTQFYRWTESYTPDELDRLVARKSGIDFGHITALTPLRRGSSGRITLLKITGAKRTAAVGKELEIRKWLSESHLKSSAFTVDFKDGRWVIDGAGWGHGVGLCQIGAAVMASKGYDFKQILQHYYPGSELTKLY